MKTGLIDVGGGLRGIYAAGVCDRCADDGISFDLGIGISAGSANLASFFARQRGRNYAFYTDYPFRREYMSLKNFLTKHTYIDLDYVYSVLSNDGCENPLDYDAFMANPAQFLVVAADAETGETKYFDAHEMPRNHYDIFKASCAIPFICRPYPVDGRLYFDGALGDTVPLEKAFALGCDRVVLLLTKPISVPRSPKADERIARLIRRKYPRAAERLLLRAKRYNDGVARAKECAKEGRVLIVAPDDTCGVNTLTKDKDALARLYEKGYRDGAAVKEFLAK